MKYWRLLLRILIIATVLVLVVTVLLNTVFKRSGGEGDFDGIVVSVDGEFVTVKVTAKSWRRLPDLVVFDSTLSGSEYLKPGDNICADYIYKSLKGNRIKVFSVIVK